MQIIEAHAFISCGGKAINITDITTYIKNYWIPVKKGEMALLLKMFDNIYQNIRNEAQEKADKEYGNRAKHSTKG